MLGRSYVPPHTRIVNGKVVPVDGYWRAGRIRERDDGTFEQRLGRCYELAGRYASKHDGSILVHGSIQGMGNPRIKHAWVVLPNGDVYDAVLDQKIDSRVHEAFFGAVEDTRYTREQVLKRALKHGHWGPWDG